MSDISGNSSNTTITTRFGVFSTTPDFAFASPPNTTADAGRAEEEQRREQHRRDRQEPQPDPHPLEAEERERGEQPGDPAEVHQPHRREVRRALQDLLGEDAERQTAQQRVHVPAQPRQHQPDQHLDDVQHERRDDHDEQREQDQVEARGTSGGEDARVLAEQVERRLGDGDPAQREQLERGADLALAWTEAGRASSSGPVGRGRAVAVTTATSSAGAVTRTGAARRAARLAPGPGGGCPATACATSGSPVAPPRGSSGSRSRASARSR